MVTANKNPLIENLDTFKKLTSNNGRYQFQCSVMAGAGAIRAVDEAYELKEKILRIRGCFSGTLAYLCSEMRKGKLFSRVMSMAEEKGYSETDSRDDLSGFDASKKLLILARRAGYNVDLKDLQIKPFLPKEAFRRDESAKDFMKRTNEYDNYFKELMNQAKLNGSTLQYMAEMYKPSVEDLLNEGKQNIPIPIPTKLKVGLEQIPSSHLFGGLEGTLNGFEIITNERYPEDSPLIITAPGAGLNVTAGNVRIGLNRLKEILRRLSCC